MKLKCLTKARLWTVVCLAMAQLTDLQSASLIPFGANWKYLDDGSDQGTAWKEPGFNDNSWASGPAELGYGDGDEATVVEDNPEPGYQPGANDRYPTTYFRHTFNIADASIYTQLIGSLVFDDGAVVYLNGVEVHRVNMPEPFDYLSFATTAADYPEPSLFGADEGLLVDGDNVMAVEIHQGNANSSDISMDLELIGNTDVIVNNPPDVAILSPANDSFFSAPASFTITASASDSDFGDSVVSVEFFQGVSSLGVDPSSPYTVDILNLPPGAYQYTAVATDTEGDSTTSAPINITVQLASAPTIQSVLPAPGSINSLSQITVVFSEPVTGVRASDLIVNGKSAKSMFGSGTTYTFVVPRLDEGTIYVAWDGKAKIRDQENPPQPFDIFGAGARWQYTLNDNAAPTVVELSPVAGALVNALDRIEVKFSEPVIGINAEDLRINGVPATSVDGHGDGPYRFDFPQPSPGTVNVNWAGTHGITDPASPPNAFGGGNWTYTLDTNAVFEGQIVINEIMFNPDSTLPEHEFIELFNRGGSSVDLVGWRLTRGVNYTFPDISLGTGQYLVVAADVAAFSARYPGVGNVVGGWTGRLSNGHEDVELEDALGARVDLVDYADEGDFAQRVDLGNLGLDWASDADGLGSSLELRNAALSNNQGQNWGSSIPSGGTPGTANSLASADIAPMILDVAHFPVIPTSTEAVTITARILDELTTGLTVRLRYREISGGGSPSFATLTMSDDGSSNDGLAGDGIFGAVLPPMGDGSIVEFYVEAEDAGNLPRTWPAPVDDGGLVQSANAYYQVDNEVYAGNQPIYRLILQPSDLNTLLQGSSDALVRNTTFISVDGADVKLRYLCGLRRRGASSVNATPPTMKLEIPSDRTWNGKSSMNLNSVNTYAQVLGSALALKAGLPAANARAVQLRFNSSNESRSDSQMFGSYAHVEVLDNEWAADHFPLDDDGNVYSKRRGGGTDCDERLLYLGNQIQSYINCGYDKESNSSENDWSDLMSLLFALDDATTPDNEYVQAVERNANVDLWLRYFAVIYLMNYNETALGTVANDDYDLYRGVIDPRFIILVHDFDSIFGSAGNAGNSIFQATETDNVDRFLFHPEFETRYYEEFRFQLAHAFDAVNLNALIDQVLGDWVPSGTLDGMKANAANRRANALSQLPAEPADPRATISGEPDSSTYLDSAMLTVGGDDITHYRYRVNGGALSAETTVGTPISLSGLADGIYTVFVIGRDSNGVWQDATEATASKTWAVLSNLRGVIINEVLARNDSAVNHEGTFPDMVELFNAGASTIDLSGKRLTDNLDNPDKFVFPAETTLNSGAYLVLYANDPDGTSGTHLGFTLAAEGETLYLLDTDANGAIVLDSIKFGWQLADLSVGRLPGGAWGLASPTFGSANVPVATGDDSLLKINEWLADASAPFFEDFVELYNPGSLPVALGDLFFTDRPIGDPFRDGITRLSFIDGQSYLAFIADGNESAGADHLEFQLSREEGEIALLREDGSIIDCVVYGPQRPAVSMGRSPNGSPNIVFLDLPTPGAGNPTVSGPLPPIMVELVPIDGVWSYDASGSDLGTSWSEVGFNDGSWPTGQGLFGEETTPQILPEPILTPIPAPQSGGPITTYYRTHFTFDASQNVSDLEASVIYDDGCIIYLNGSEVQPRLNMPSGTVNFDDTASGSHEATSAETYSLGISDLVDGDNVIAVELHQRDPGSSDAIFGLSLNAIILTNNPAAAGVVINEILANNATLDEADGSNPDWVELYNPSNQAVDLAGMSLTDDPLDAQRWIFPAGSVVPAMGYRRILFDSGSPPSDVNTGFGLSAEGDAVYLFDAPASGGALLDAIIFGIQAPDWPIGRLPDGDANITLVQPSPNGVNLAATLGDPGLLKVNEWMADPASGDDWFEIYNPNAQPVALGGLHLTDDLNNRLQHPIADLSFIAAGFRGFQEFKADSNVDAGADHVNFRLGASGEALAISDAAGSLIDAVTFGQQLTGISEGLLPDGSASIVSFATTSSPGAANYLPIADVAINEVLTHSDLPFEDAIELRNLSGSSVDIGGWFLSDAQAEPKKFRIPDGTILSPNGFTVFYENEFNPNPGGPLSFSLSSARGDEVFLSAAQSDGTLTGFKDVVEFGPAANGVSFGRYMTSVGVDFTAMSLRTFGADNPETIEEFRTGDGLANSLPLVGPIVINEVMYHPPDIGGTIDNTLDEYIELHNITGAAVPLFDINFTTNTWRLRDAVKFNFPENVSIPAGGYLLVVSFDPALDTDSLNAFRATYGLSSSVPIFGPYEGKLDNSSDSVELYKPDPPQGPGSPDEGLVPYVLTDLLVYEDVAPWPTSPDGLGDSLQRSDSSLYGNDPVNWFGDAPTPGADNQGSSGNARPVLDPIGNKVVIEENLLTFTATASDPDEPGQSLTFSLAPGAPSGVSIHPSSGVFTWTPTEAQGPAGYSITVIVTDDGTPAQSDTETISVTVNEDNQPPVLALIGNRSGNEGELLTFFAMATDADAPVQDLVFSLDAPAPSGASINPDTGEFRWIPAEDQGPGSYDVTIRVTDVASLPLSDFEEITITVDEINRPPTTTLIGLQTVEEGSLLSLSIPAQDPDIPAQALSFAIDSGALSGMSVHPTSGLFQWTPSVGQGPSTNQVGIRISDNGLPPLSVVNTFTIVVTDVNTEPTLDPIADRSIDEGQTLSFQATGSDDDSPAQNLTFSLQAGAPAGADIDPFTGQFTWTPAENQGPNTNTITVVLTDDGTPNLSDTESFTVVVNEVNQSPVLDPIGDRGVTRGGTLTFTATASDEDLPAQSLNFSLDVGAPSGAVIDPQSGAFSWTPSAGQADGDYPITIRVTDDGAPALYDFETITVTLSEAPVTVTLLGYDQVWTYDQNGVDLGPTWTNPSYDDSNWPRGPGLLGEETTPAILPQPIRTDILAPRSGGPLTTYFRTHFTLAADPAGVTLVSSNIYDDGMIVYLNGAEVLRLNMPGGAVTVDTPSSGSHEANTIETTNIVASSLVCGDNVLAVELHQQPGNSSDAVFGMLLEATVPPQPGASIVTEPSDLTVNEGEPALFAVTASGACPIYQWYFEGVAIPGANESTYTIAAASIGDAGLYHVVVSNLFGSATSRDARLTVDSPVNSAPVLGSIGDRTVRVGELLTFTAMASDPNVPPQTLTFSLDPGAPSGASIDPVSGVFNWTPSMAQGKGVYPVTIRVADNGVPPLDDFESIDITVTDAPLTVSLLGFDQVWKYDQNGVDLGTSWRELAYDDAAWPSGPGVLGQETTPAVLPLPIQTDILAPASGGPITTYFRTRFTLAADPAGVTLISSNIYDDGMIVYLNGAEVLRLNMPGGAVTVDTTSSGSHEANTIETTNIIASSLVCGDNVLAVELHQQAINSSDAVFAMAMEAEVPAQPGVGILSQPMAQTVDEGSSASFSVVADGACPQYQWYKDDVIILGATAEQYFIPSAQLSDEGEYHVEVSNLFGMVASSKARLTVNPAVNTPPRIGHIARDGDVVTLMWESIPGRLYQVQYKERLNDSIWIDLGPPILATDTSTATTDNSATNLTRFYQVVLLP